MKRLIKALREMMREKPLVDAGYLNHADDVGGINDGVDYSLPVMLPLWLRTSLQEAGKLGAWLTENTRTTFGFQFDTPNRDQWDGAVMPVSEDPLREWDEATRERVLTNCHAAYQRNPIAKRGINYVASFVVGEGFNLACRNDRVEAVLKAFIDNPENDVRAYERQAVIDLQLDGELVTRFFEAGGNVVMVPQRPWELRRIKTEAGFFRRPVLYHFQREESEGDWRSGTVTKIEDVKASEILHVAINRHGYELRGRPELYPVLPWLRAYKEWLENRARQNHWRNALLWWVKVKAANSAVIAQVAARYRRPPTPGSIAVTSENEEWNALQNNVGAGDAAEDGRQIKLMAAVGMGLPEYFLGDGENANLATAKEQALPALMTFADFQRVMVEQYWYPVLTRVIQAAVDAEVLPEMVEEMDAEGDPVKDADGVVKMVAAVDAFDVSYEPIQKADIKTIVDAMRLAYADEAVSLETYRREIGVDPDIEAKRISRERQQQRDAMARGEQPMPPGMIPDGYADDTEAPETPPRTRGEGESGTQRRDEAKAQVELLQNLHKFTCF